MGSSRLERELAAGSHVWVPLPHPDPLTETSHVANHPARCQQRVAATFKRNGQDYVLDSDVHHLPITVDLTKTSHDRGKTPLCAHDFCAILTRTFTPWFVLLQLDTKNM